MMGSTDRLLLLVAPLLGFATYVIGQFAAASIRRQDSPRVERDSMISSAERAINIMKIAMGELQDRVTELEAENARLEAENEQLRRRHPVGPHVTSTEQATRSPHPPLPGT